MGKYRLTPKPGIARVGRQIHNGTPSIILVNQTKTPPVSAPQPQPQSVPAAKVNPVKQVKISSRSPTPLRKQVDRRSKPVKSSPLRKQVDIESSKYRQAIEGLKGVGKGRILVMVACGPSILEADLPRLKNHSIVDIMLINKPDPRLYPTKYWVFCDQSQYIRNSETFEKYQGTVINTWSVRARHPKQILVRNKSGKGFSKNLMDGYYIGRSTTYANMQTAHWMDYDKVFIFGCDMCQPSGLAHVGLWAYGVNPDVEPDKRIPRFQNEAKHYDHGADQLSQSERNRFVFCSAYNPWSFVDKFQKLDHREAVQKILDLADSMVKP